MERKIDAALLAWKRNPGKLPLVMRGARQVGKTYTLLSFGQRHYKNVAYLNLEDSNEFPAVFKPDLDPERIVRELAAMMSQTIFPEETLLIFDEVQACEQALTSLKYFAERAPHYHVIAAGSLLGVTMRREKCSFPVGKVDFLHLWPMDFEEFLWALGQKESCDLIFEAYESFRPLSMHATMMERYKTYLSVGGLPRAVREFAENGDFKFVTSALKSLNDSYVADMAKYATAQETFRLMAAWGSIPAQLAKENRKFQYKTIKTGARARDYELSLEWLRAAGMINKCAHVTEGKLPLSAYARSGEFKVYMVDTGLLRSKLDLPPEVLLHTPHSFDGFKGALAENYICQALVANGMTPYYWTSPGKAEVDFVYQDQSGNVIPLEAKSAENTRSKSLNRYREMFKPAYAVRVSAKNFGFENGIKSLPLYAMFCLKP
jgi:predicted AAA+ superfamily ATPase